MQLVRAGAVAPALKGGRLEGQSARLLGQRGGSVYALHSHAAGLAGHGAAVVRLVVTTGGAGDGQGGLQSVGVGREEGGGNVRRACCRRRAQRRRRRQPLAGPVGPRRAAVGPPKSQGQESAPPRCNGGLSREHSHLGLLSERPGAAAASDSRGGSKEAAANTAERVSGVVDGADEALLTGPLRRQRRSRPSRCRALSDRSQDSLPSSERDPCPTPAMWATSGGRMHEWACGRWAGDRGGGHEAAEPPAWTLRAWMPHALAEQQAGSRCDG